jgi:hypothetical protein
MGTWKPTYQNEPALIEEIVTIGMMSLEALPRSPQLTGVRNRMELVHRLRSSIFC